LTQGVELQRKTTEAKNALTALETRRTRLISEQDRIRRNLEAAGNQSTQGQEYLRRMAAMDGEIDTLNTAVVEAETILQEAQNNFTVFLTSIDL
jgi:predicted  nucleic acid-binding Zn-ribbon protein